MSDVILLLPNNVANQIAAGEVIERPSSVVKELLENAIDAKANFVQLILKEAGKNLIQVIDNGTGMNINDAQTAFKRYATSKIRSIQDIFSIYTKGFRGEALAAIAAMARVELKTKRKFDEIGTHIFIEGGRFISQNPIQCLSGSTFIIKNLFFNIPARRKFLKSNVIEFKHILGEFFRVALSHPNIKFQLFHNNKEIFYLKSSSLMIRISELFEKKYNTF